MKEKIFNNFSLKILSALCAVVLWAIIVNIYDPNTGFTISNVNVQLINTESLTDKNYTFEIVDGGKISVYVSGPKSVITNIKSSDIVATADLSQITAFADYVDIDVKVVKDGRVLNNVAVTPKTTAVRLNIENRVTKDFTIQTELSGSPAGGYVVTDYSVSPTTVKITGAASLVEQIDKVKVVCDVNGAAADIAAETPVILCDAEGNAFENSALEIARTSVEYRVSIGAAKTVPIRCEGTSGTPANGFAVQGTEVSMQEAVVTGDAQILDALSEIVIPAAALNAEGSNADKTVRVDLSTCVPNGIRITSDKIVTVTIKVSAVNRKSLTYDTQLIRLEGLANGLKVQIEAPETLSLLFSGTKEQLNALDINAVRASARLDGLTEGTHTLTVQFAISSSCTLLDTYSIQVRIEAAQAETEPTTAAVQQETTSGSTIH